MFSVVIFEFTPADRQQWNSCRRRCCQSWWKDPPYPSVGGLTYGQGLMLRMVKKFLSACRFMTVVVL